MTAVILLQRVRGLHKAIRECECPSILHYLGHHNDVIMSAMPSQITGVWIVCWTICSRAEYRKHQSCASLAYTWGIHRWPVYSPHKRPVTREMFLFDDVIMVRKCYLIHNSDNTWSVNPFVAVYMHWTSLINLHDKHILHKLYMWTRKKLMIDIEYHIQYETNITVIMGVNWVISFHETCTTLGYCLLLWKAYYPY